MKEQNISIYKNLQEISALRFHEIKFTGNVKLVNKNHEEEQKYSNDEVNELNLGWLALYDEYFKRSTNTRLVSQLKNKDQTLTLLLEINTLEKVIGLLRFVEDQKEYMPNEVYQENIIHFSNELKRLNKRLALELTQDIKPQIQAIEDYKGGLQSRYEILFKKDLQIEEIDIQRYYEIKTQIAEILQMDDIPDFINMLQWIVYENKALVKARNGKDYGNRIKKRKMGRST